MIVFDRSRREAWEKCKRLRWHAYEQDGLGYHRKGFPVDLLIGGVVHTGMETTLGGGDEEEAVSMALEDLGRCLEKEGLAEEQVDDNFILSTIPYPPETPFVMVAIVEALVRGWTRVRWPLIKRDFDILMVEKELEYKLAEDILFLSRADFVGRRKLDGSIFVFNFKTVSDPGFSWRNKWQYDQQTFSECLGVEKELGEEVAGVIIEGLVKGKESVAYPEKKSRKYWSSPLIWQWRKENGAPFEPEVASRYENDLGQRLGRGFSRYPVWKLPEGVKGWLDWLEQNDPELLREQFISLPPVMRAAYEIEEWKQTAEYEEPRIAMYGSDTPIKVLPLYFPKSTSNANCIGYGSKGRCPMFEVCWENADIHDKTLYKQREPNHPKEIEWKRINAYNASVAYPSGDDPGTMG